MLFEAFVQQFNYKCGFKKFFSDDAIRLLTTYEWRGNIRELSHFVERLLVIIDAKIVKPKQLPISFMTLKITVLNMQKAVD